MEQITLNLKTNSQRPVISMGNTDALLDTGALFPVWVGPISMLLRKDARLIKRNVSFTGFGGKAVGDLYELSYFCVGKLIFPSMPVIACEDLSGDFDIILSATMFEGLIYEIDTINSKLNITIPSASELSRRISIKTKDNRVYVLTQAEERTYHNLTAMDAINKLKKEWE